MCDDEFNALHKIYQLVNQKGYISINAIKKYLHKSYDNIITILSKLKNYKLILLPEDNPYKKIFLTPKSEDLIKKLLD